MANFVRLHLSVSIVGGPQIYLAGILTAEQISREATIAITVDKENVAPRHATGNVDSIFGFKDLADTKANTLAQVSSNDQGAIAHDTSATPRFGNGVCANQQFAPASIKKKKQIYDRVEATRVMRRIPEETLLLIVTIIG
jgi:hypothetical protein